MMNTINTNRVPSEVIEAAKLVLEANQIGLRVFRGNLRWVRLPNYEWINDGAMVRQLLMNNGISFDGYNFDDLMGVLPRLQTSRQALDRLTTPANVDEAIKDALEQMGIKVFTAHGSVSFRDGFSVFNQTRLVPILYRKLKEMGYRVPERELNLYLSAIATDYLREYDREIVERFRHRPELSEKAKTEIERAMRLISGKHYHWLYPVLFYHTMQIIKKRAAYHDPATIKYPLLMSVYSKRGHTGKSFFVNKWLEPIPPSLRLEVAHLDVLVNVENRGYEWSETLVLIATELSGITQSDIHALKSKIDSWSSAYRPFYTQTTNRDMTRATIIGTSNRPLKEVLKDGPFPRKWWELPYEHRGSCEQQERVWKELDTIDWLSVWQGIDENGRSPLIDHYDEFLKLAAATCGNPEYADVNKFLKLEILRVGDTERAAGVDIYDLLKKLHYSMPKVKIDVIVFDEILRAVGYTTSDTDKGLRYHPPPIDKCILFDQYSVVDGKNVKKEAPTPAPAPEQDPSPLPEVKGIGLVSHFEKLDLERQTEKERKKMKSAQRKTEREIKEAEQPAKCTAAVNYYVEQFYEAEKRGELETKDKTPQEAPTEKPKQFETRDPEEIDWDAEFAKYNKR